MQNLKIATGIYIDIDFIYDLEKQLNIIKGIITL